MKIKVNYFTEVEMARVGTGICPECDKKVYIANTNGKGGNRNFDYIEDHIGRSNTSSCKTSNVDVNKL